LFVCLFGASPLSSILLCATEEEEEEEEEEEDGQAGDGISGLRASFEFPCVPQAVRFSWPTILGKLC
jgi:hypothetical protein